MGAQSAKPDISGTEAPNPADAGLQSLWLVASVLGEQLDVARLRHEYIEPGQFACADDLLRIARAEGLKARRSKSSPARLANAPLPAIASSRAGGFFVLARANSTHALIAHPDRPPVEIPLSELDALWTGELILVTKREALGGDVRDCRNFRVRAITMRMMEASNGKAKTTAYFRRAAGPAFGGS